MSAMRGLSLGWRLGVGLSLAGEMLYFTQSMDWQSPSNAFLRPLSFPMMGLIAVLMSILIQSFSRRFNIFEVLVTAVIVFVLGCLLFPTVIPDHSRRRERAILEVRPVTSRP
jgi:cytochrome bd-type quinol oxidase subunit 2